MLTMADIRDARILLVEDQERSASRIAEALALVGTVDLDPTGDNVRSAEHTSELQSLMRISYADFCLNTTKTRKKQLMNSHHYIDTSLHSPHFIKQHKAT